MSEKKFEVKPYSKEEVKKILGEVDQKLFDFIKSDKYKDVLMTMGNLGKYSLTNQIYILLQNPDATTVNGMKQWNYLGRSILPGQKALKIFAPITGKYKRNEVDENGNPLLGEDGKPITKEVTEIKGFKPSFVFDISQTKGRELECFKFNESIKVEDKELIQKGLENVVGKKGFTIEFTNQETLGKGCYGLCNHEEKKILILEGMSDLQTVSTMVHESGHALAHGPYCKGFEGLTPMEKREIKEVEAESIACVVCSHLGLDTENFNFSYISGWADGDISKFRNNMDVIGKHSLALIEGIDGAFHQTKKEKDKALKEEKVIIPEPEIINSTRHISEAEAV